MPKKEEVSGEEQPKDSPDMQILKELRFLYELREFIIAKVHGGMMGDRSLQNLDNAILRRLDRIS